MHRSFKLIPALLLALGVVSSPVLVYANSDLNQINQQINQLHQQKNASLRKVQNAEQQIKDLKLKQRQANQQLNQLMNQIDQAANMAAELQTSSQAKAQELSLNAKALQDAEDRVAQRDRMLADKLDFLYMNGSASFLDVLMHATTFSDFLTRLDSLRSMVQFDHSVLLSNRKDKELIARKQADLKQALSDIQQQYHTAQQQQQRLVSKKADNKVQIAGLSEQEHLLEDMSSEEDAALQKLADQEAALLEKKHELENQQSDNGPYPKPPFSRASDFSNEPKGQYLSWPLAKNYVITSPYGTRVDPITGKKGAYHDGIDIGAPSGTPILAAQSGTVIIAQYYGSAGNCVMIDHGHGIRTMYDHMQTGSFKVKEGDHVRAGQELGLVGMTGRATGPHLHFGVYYSGTPIDPWQLLRNRG